MGFKTAENETKNRKTKAVLAAGAVAGTVAATAAYRRRQARPDATAQPAPDATHQEPPTG